MDMNPKLVNMAERDTIFEDAAPDLLGINLLEAEDREDQQEDFKVKIDLKEAYFVVPISESDKKYLRFR